ncbi:MAG: SpoIIE family protein phosphatase, partial [Crocinitomicaceae bacterium]|nr:SpoIIE family protein phosphatase [Crocinitomicaceae bacterium]
SSAPTYITEDKNGEVWMSTEANGLVNYKKNGIYLASNPNYGESFMVTSQNADSTIYMASEKGVYYLKKGRVRTFIEFSKFKMNDVKEIVVLDTSNVLLFSNDHGVISCKEKNEVWNYEHAGKVQMFFARQLSDSLYCGTTGGSSLYTFNIYTHETKEIFCGFTDSLQLGLIYAVRVHPQTKHIWLGTYDTRTIIELTGTDTIVYTEKDGIPGGALFDFAFDKNGVCWFLNADGAFGYLDKDHFVSFESFLVTAYDGLTFDRHGNLWMGNSLGAMFVELEDYKIKSWRQFNKYDGIPETRGQIGNIFTLMDGRIMISKYDDACYIINPDEIKPDIEKPSIYLKGIYGKDHAALDSLWYTQTEGFFHVPLNLELPYDQNNITIDLGAVYFSQPDSLRFSYVLEGFNDTWSDYQKTATVTFTNLPNNEYVFKCKALGANGNESEILSFSFKVKTPWFKTWLFYIIIVLLTSGLIYLFVKWRLSKLEKDKLKLQAIVEERTKEVVLEKEKVEEKNREILDSITYAKRIQAAIMPPAKLVKEYLKDSFIIYQPKDIVAGDFYWMHAVENKAHEIIFAAADCTGHGVPGAMVSVVCNNGLNRSVREYAITDPGKILDKTREIVISEFEKSEDQVKDGMDISLCSLNIITNELKWAGANNPLWIVQTRNNETNLTEIKPDKQPIGKYANAKPFTTHELKLEKGDLIYLFTDGFQDQFGGEKGKKFKASSFKSLLLKIHDLPMHVQEERIMQNFEQWKGSFEQLDDICIIGVRIS